MGFFDSAMGQRIARILQRPMGFAAPYGKKIGSNSKLPAEKQQQIISAAEAKRARRRALNLKNEGLRHDRQS